MEDYTANGATATAQILEASLVAQPILDLAQDGAWEGTASELLAKLNELISEQVRRQKTWPGSPQAVSNALRRLAPTLMVEGVEVSWPPRTSGRRVITIKKVTVSGVRPVTPVTGTDKSPLLGAVADAESSSPPSSRATASDPHSSDGHDGHDEVFPDLTDGEETGSL
jgi:hypothetical protein